GHGVDLVAAGDGEQVADAVDVDGVDGVVGEDRPEVDVPAGQAGGRGPGPVALDQLGAHAVGGEHVRQLAAPHVGPEDEHAVRLGLGQVQGPGDRAGRQ